MITKRPLSIRNRSLSLGFVIPKEAILVIGYHLSHPRFFTNPFLEENNSSNTKPRIYSIPVFSVLSN